MPKEGFEPGDSGSRMRRPVPDANTGMDQTPMPPQASTYTEVEFSIMDVLLVLARRWRFMLGFTFVCSLLSLLFALKQKPFYTATTTLLPPTQSPSAASTLISQMGSQSPLQGLAVGGLKSPSDLYIGLLRSTTVEDDMISRFNLMSEDHVQRLSDARRILEQQCTIDASQRDGIIRISVRSASPVRAAELANGYVDSFKRLSASLAISEASQRRLFLSQQLVEAKDSLANAEEDLKKTELQGGVIQVDTQARALISSAGVLRSEIAAKEVQLQSMRIYAGSENPELLQAQQELSGLREQLAKLSGPGDSDSGLVPSKGQLPTEALEYGRKEREVKYNETIFDILARQYEAAKMDEAKEGAVVQVIDRATPPDRKSGPWRLEIVVVGTGLGAAFAFVWTLLTATRRYFRRTAEYQTIAAALK